MDLAQYESLGRGSWGDRAQLDMMSDRKEGAEGGVEEEARRGRQKGRLVCWKKNLVKSTSWGRDGNGWAGNHDG